MLINLPTHQLESVGARFANQENNSLKESKMARLYYLSFLYDLFREIYQKAKLRLRYKILRKNHQSDLARQKINILMDLIIGESKSLNSDYDNQVNPNQLWSKFLYSDNPYKIQHILYVERIFKDILEITFTYQDCQILTLILDRLLEISSLSQNSKRKYFTNMIQDKINHGRPYSNVDYIIDRSQMISAYIKWAFRNDQQLLLFHPLFNQGTINYYLLNEIITASLISRNYKLLYQIRIICHQNQKISYFIHNLLQVIIEQLYDQSFAIFRLKSNPEDSVRKVMPIVYDHFQKLNNTEDISEEEFEKSLEIYFGPLAIDFYGRNKKFNSIIINADNSEEKSKIIKKAGQFLDLTQKLVTKLKDIQKDSKFRNKNTGDSLISIYIQRNHLIKLISYYQNQISPF